MSWILIYLFSYVAFSQERLDPIEVSSGKDVERFTFSIPGKIQRHQLEAQPLMTIAPELEKIPGIVSNQNGGPGGRVSYFIRGTESRHVSFTLDGLKLNDTSNTDRQFDAAFFTAPMLKEIQVFKGPQAVLYGSDAMGGLIELTSRKGETAPEGQLTLNVGSFGTIGSSLTKDWAGDANSGTVSATRFHSDGISRLNNKRYRAQEKDATDITQVSSSSAHSWSSKLHTNLLAAYLNGKAEQDGFASDNSYDFSRNDQYIFQQKTVLAQSEHHSWSLRNGFNRHQRFNQSLMSGEEFFNGNLLQNELMHRLDCKSFSSLAGIASERESARAQTLNRSFELHSLFLQTALELSYLKFHLGGRMDKHSRYGTFLTGAGGISWGDFSYQYSQGYKAPSLYQLYGPPSAGSPVGNPELIPESNHYSELAWKNKWNVSELGVTLFQNRLSNLFTYSFTQGYLNQQRFIAEGIEVSGKWKGSMTLLYGSFTHQNFREAGAPVLRRPKNIHQAGVSYFLSESVELNLNGRWFSSRKDFSAKLNPYEVFDAGVKKSWKSDDVSLQLRNILNREYEELFGFNVLPRSVFGNYTHRF